MASGVTESGLFAGFDADASHSRGTLPIIKEGVNSLWVAVNEGSFLKDSFPPGATAVGASLFGLAPKRNQKMRSDQLSTPLAPSPSVVGLHATSD